MIMIIVYMVIAVWVWYIRGDIDWFEKWFKKWWEKAKEFYDED